MEQGKVIWFNIEKGFGFIKGSDKDYFAHYKEILSDGHKMLKANQHVRFTPDKSPRGHVARGIEIIK